MSVEIEIGKSTEALDELSGNMMSAGKEWLEEFGQHMIEVTKQTFDALAHGGSFRGVTWPYFKNKPSRSRGGTSARLLNFTGNLKTSVGAIFNADSEKLELGSDAPYALHQQRMRPFLFFDLPADAITAAQTAARFINKSSGESVGAIHELPK